MKQFLFTQLPDQYKINAIIKKVPDGIFGLGTKYLVSIEQNNKFLFSVVKDGIGKFLFSMSKDKISLKNKSYLGKLQSNFVGDQFILYDYGFDPKQTKNLEFSHKQVAYIKYEQSSGPRKFETILTTNNKGFFSIQSDSNILLNKWKNKDRKYLCRLYSKQPQFDPTDGYYKLDFKGLTGKASIKNFILNNDKYLDSLIFARRSQDTFALQVKSPFSLLQAVAVCISSIHYKSLI